MNVGLLFCLRNPPQWRRDFPQLYAENLAHMQLAEELGYDMIWLSEHHFSEDGYSPSLLPIASAAGALTRTIRIGTMLILLPLHNALRVAEDAATVDIISAGRFELGVGLGYTRGEFEGYGVSRKERASRLEEGLEVIRGAWTETPYSFAGRHYDLQNVRLTPKPAQAPHPPIWVGAGVPKAIDRVARLGHGFLGPGSVEAHAAYDAALLSYGRDPAAHGSAHHHWCYVSESRDQAWDDVQDHLHYMLSWYNVWLNEGGDGFPGGQRDSMPPASQLRHMAPELSGSPIVGTPDEVYDRIAGLASQIRTTHIVLGMHMAGLRPEKAEASMRLFAKEVLPRLRALSPAQSIHAP